MQIKITLDSKDNIILPLGHHAALQGFIYSIIKSNPEYSEFLHNEGYGNSAHRYKLFVFSTLRGHHKIINNKIIFTDKICLEIRSPKNDFCDILLKSLQTSDSLELFRQPIALTECSFSKKTITEEDINIRMLSPITLSTTEYENEKKHTRYIMPTDSDFNNALNHNLQSKYEAFTGHKCTSDVSLTPLSFSEKDKYVTKFNNRIYINAWNGDYRLQGPSELLTFLYDTGLGSRNSQGFGMFDIMDR